MNRRTFLRGALRTAAAASAGGAGLLLRGCSKGKDLDLLVASARSGKSPYEFTRDLLAEETGRVGIAAHLGFVRRGMLKVGWAADVCVFDPARVADRATFAEPAVYPDGIEKVVVNGEVVVDAGTHTGRLPGKLLRKNARGEVA